MFDLNDTIELVLPTADGDKLCIVKHPTDEQWAARYRERYTQIRNLGNGVTENKTMNREAADIKLLAAIQQNKLEVVFDDTEATILIDQLATCDVVDIVKANKSYVITLNTVLGEVEVIVGIPPHKELKKTIESCMSIRGGRFNTSTIHMHIQPGGDLFDKYVESVKDYTPDTPKAIPLIHKYKAIDVIQGEVTNIVTKSKVEPGETFPTPPGQKPQA